MSKPNLVLDLLSFGHKLVWLLDCHQLAAMGAGSPMQFRHVVWKRCVRHINYQLYSNNLTNNDLKLLDCKCRRGYTRRSQMLSIVFLLRAACDQVHVEFEAKSTKSNFR